MKFYQHTLVIASLCLASSCQKKDPADSATGESTTTIELLSHTEGKFAVSETITVDASQTDITIGGKSFKLKARWDDAEVKRETLNDNPKESHAVELAWSAVDKRNATNEHSLWVFPAVNEEHEAPLLTDTTVQPRFLPPGSRIVTQEEIKKSPLRGVQFEWKNKRYNIPATGQQVFPGWKVIAIRSFQHALLNDNGTITESKDTSFTNRAVEISVEATGGSKERHLCFIDHPRLTAGIHPTLLPVSRISGDLASLAKLRVCETLQAPAEKNLLVISPDTEGTGVTALTWIKGNPAPTSQQIKKFPATLTLGNQTIELKQHWANARRQIKWQQKEDGSDDKKQPALLIESGGHFHAKQFVLIQGKATPCRIMDDIILLKYK
jgi:hypothetical protein